MTRTMASLVSVTGIFLIWLLASLSLDGSVTGGRSAANAAASVATPRPDFARVGHPMFLSPHVSPIAVSGEHVFVANTPADTVDVIDAATRQVHARINVGIDPVSVAVRPDGREIWVSNHVSDSVSVIDNDSASATYLQVVATIQEFDPETKATRFDEPVGIAFAGSDKAYVALSSENEIAVIDVATRSINQRLKITAQDPRAIAVRGDRLYVIPFESNNQTQLSGGLPDEIDGELVTFDIYEHSVRNNNVLSLGHVTDIVKHPDVPDRDLFVFDTTTDELVDVVDTLGTLLYGLTVDSQGRVYVAQTDARNDVNGRAGTQRHTLTEMANRAFLNRITSVEFNDGVAQQPTFIDLEPLPPDQPEQGQALATPFAIEISEDDATLVVSSAGSDKIFTVDVASGAVLGRIAVGAVPRGIALENDEAGQPSQAWVLNAVANTVSLVDLSDVAQPRIAGFVRLDDPTHPQVKLGRTWFNDAAASTTGTFSCASCHPDGHTDQLLWVLKTPVVTGGEQIMPRSTMPVRGLRDTAPFHWDGIPGDPFGGNNSANIYGSDPPNSDPDKPTSATRHLIDGGLATTMFLEGNEKINDEGKAGHFSAAERDDMALFLLGVPFPPAQGRAYTNVVSERAKEGFRLFHVAGNYEGKPRPNVCGNCHRMPFLVSTNTPITGMDAPTWRGATDRWLLLPQGRINVIGLDFFRQLAEEGIPERKMWQLTWRRTLRFDPVWEMVLEGSTGFSGAFARQLTLNEQTAADELTEDLWSALELSAAEGAVVLQGEGVLLGDSSPAPLALQFISQGGGDIYVSKEDNRQSFTRDELVALAAGGKFVGTFTARHGAHADVEHPQPALWTLGPMEQQRGRQEFPVIYEGNSRIMMSGRHIGEQAHVIVNGRRVPGTVTVDGETVVVDLAALPPVGMHLLQIQNPGSLFSNDFIFHVAADAEDAQELDRRIKQGDAEDGWSLAEAVSRGDLVALKELLDGEEDRDLSSLLRIAASFGKFEVAEFLIARGADVHATDNGGNTPLHAAAFFCHREIVQLLLDHGSSPRATNLRGSTPVDGISSPWSEETASNYVALAGALGMEAFEVDFERIQRERPLITQLMRDHLTTDGAVGD